MDKKEALKKLKDTLQEINDNGYKIEIKLTGFTFEIFSDDENKV